jgi:hypothetical protein
MILSTTFIDHAKKLDLLIAKKLGTQQIYFCIFPKVLISQVLKMYKG